MKRGRWLWIGACAGAVVCALIASRLARSTAERRPAAPAAVDAGALAPHPKAVVDADEHDFGFLDVADSARHVFVIRNEGAGPLRLERGGTSCKCTMSHLPEGEIPPGGAAEVAVSTKATAAKGGLFRHTANILTNDPERKVISLTVRGVYRTFLAAQPERIDFPRAGREGDGSEPLRAEVAVFSQAFEQFDLSSVSATLEGVSWEIEPLAADVLEPLEAKCGYRIAMVLPDDLPEEGFSHTLHISAIPAGEDRKLQTLNVPLNREFVRPVQFFGPDLTMARALLLGTIAQGTSRRTTVTLKVALQPRALRVRHIAAEPEFVRVRMAPLKPDAPELGLYRIEVEVPADAPMCNHLGVEAGRVRIETDHPKVPELNLRLEFAVAGT